MDNIISYEWGMTAPETKQTLALLSNKASSAFIIDKYTISIQSDYCGCFYCHCPGVSAWLSPTPSNIMHFSTDLILSLNLVGSPSKEPTTWDNPCTLMTVNNHAT